MDRTLKEKVPFHIAMARITGRAPVMPQTTAQLKASAADAAAIAAVKPVAPPVQTAQRARPAPRPRPHIENAALEQLAFEILTLSERFEAHYFSLRRQPQRALARLSPLESLTRSQLPRPATQPASSFSPPSAAENLPPLFEDSIEPETPRVFRDVDERFGPTLRDPRLVQALLALRTRAAARRL